MIHILVPLKNNRLQYTLDLVFKGILNVEYQVISINDYNPEENIPVINYTQLILSDVFTIPNSGFLKKSEIIPIDLKIKQKGFPRLFAFTVSASSYHLDFDLFAGIFYLVSHFEKYIEKHLDKYDRYNQSDYPSAKLQLEHLPLVHIYVNYFWDQLIEFYPHLTQTNQKPSFSDQITFDIDFPWKYRHKGIKFILGGLVKDTLNGAWIRVLERLKTIFTGKDPNDTYSYIFEHCLPEKTKFFFLIDRNSEHDSRFTYQNIAYQKLIKKIFQKGYQIGIHPSFASSKESKRIETETTHLANILNKKVILSRQHFLRYQFPDTFQQLIKAGIKEDYSLCLFHTGGFPAGMAQPFYWYDLEKDEATDLLLVPSIIMDRTLQQYMGLSAEEAIIRIKELRTICQEVNGQFTLLLHNDVLSESEEWKGWREPILNFLKEIS